MFQDILNVAIYVYAVFPIMGGSMGGCPPPSHDFFFKIHPSKLMPPPSMGHPPLKNEAPHWKVKHPSRKLIIEKKTQKKLETVIITCVSLMKQHWRKMAEIPQKCDFLTWSIQNFVRKVKQFVRKYCIIWLIIQLVVFDIAPLTVLFCNYQLFSNCPLLKDIYQF